MNATPQKLTILMASTMCGIMIRLTIKPGESFFTSTVTFPIFLASWVVTSTV